MHVLLIPVYPTSRLKKFKNAGVIDRIESLMLCSIDRERVLIGSIFSETSGQNRKSICKILFPLKIAHEPMYVSKIYDVLMTVCTYVIMHAHVYTMHVYVHIYIYIYASMYVYIYMCVRICR